MRMAMAAMGLWACSSDAGFGVRIEAPDAELVVFQDGNGAWDQVELDADGLGYVQTEVGAYGIGVVCRLGEGSDSSVGLQIWFGTQPAVRTGCARVASGPFPRVRGTTAPRAKVWLASDSVTADADGHYEVPLNTPGLHDVFAIIPGSPPRVVARRAVTIESDTSIDLVPSTGVDMIALTPSIAGDATRIGADLNTPTDWVSLSDASFPATSVYVPPPAFLLATDRPAIQAHRDNCSRQHPLDAADERMLLPTPLAVEIDRERIAWTADGAVPWSDAQLSVSTPSLAWFSTTASASYRERIGDGQLALVDPGILPGWRGDSIALPPTFDWIFTISEGDRDGYHTSCSATGRLDQ